MALTGSTNAEKIWNYLKSKGLNDYACAGIIGNMDAESGLNPKNIQDSYEASLGFGDDEYVARVDSGVYTKSQFVNDGVGVFICQWTWHTRKQNLYEFIKARGKSVGDLESQLDFFYKELTEIFQPVLQALQRASSVREASDIILLRFECPLNSGASVQALRASYSQKYYDKFAGKESMKVGEEVGNVGYLTYTKGTRTKVSKYFMASEFDCHGAGCCKTTVINQTLLTILDKIREHFGTTVTITSAYRCLIHNKNVGGATGSRHSVGDAADIVVAGHTPREVAQYCESIGIKGIGLYETDKDGHFVHVDTRTSKSFWYGQAQVYRSTFGQYVEQKTTAQSSNTDFITLKHGSCGANVKVLQEKLIKIGYSCGNCGADGSFGLGTLTAVKAFQKDYNLEQDGVVGKLTSAAIDKAIAAIECGRYTVTASLLNIRSNPGTNNRIVAQIAKGSEVNITETNNGWGKMYAGWVSMQYLQRKKE